ncbi:hypothetical protein EVAR_31596_1 [Eumeta japonica]|uniref:Uncharacterized protein n=1 Tax=Eumeta variegata TaxID=151549 RepID=A0A4C1W0S1_EUMVA|nr:hypothetical protein EVAR_31596_1 [Eumeta japonica]
MKITITLCSTGPISVEFVTRLTSFLEGVDRRKSTRVPYLGVARNASKLISVLNTDQRCTVPQSVSGSNSSHRLGAARGPLTTLAVDAVATSRTDCFNIRCCCCSLTADSLTD